MQLCMWLPPNHRTNHVFLVGHFSLIIFHTNKNELLIFHLTVMVKPTEVRSTLNSVTVPNILPLSNLMLLLLLVLHIFINTNIVGCLPFKVRTIEVLGE
jgi:hypothetical protein